MALLASRPCLERAFQMHITADKHHTSYHCELQGTSEFSATSACLPIVPKHVIYLNYISVVF